MNKVGFSEPIECSNEKYITGLQVLQPGLDNINCSERHRVNEFNYPIQRKIIKGQGLFQNIEYTSNKWIEQACEVAVDSVKNGGGPFGALILQIDDETKQVIRYWRASNQVCNLNDPTAHAEIMAIRTASKALGVFNLGKISKEEAQLSQIGLTSHCEVYSSCEPCPMCYSAIFWSRIKHLYFAATRFDAEVPGVEFSDAAIYKEFSRPYTKREINVCQCAAPNALDAFNLWKNSDKMEY